MDKGCECGIVTNGTQSLQLDKQEQIMNLRVITETKIKAKGDGIFTR